MQPYAHILNNEIFSFISQKRLFKNFLKKFYQHLFIETNPKNKLCNEIFLDTSDVSFLSYLRSCRKVTYGPLWMFFGLFYQNYFGNSSNATFLWLLVTLCWEDWVTHPTNWITRILLLIHKMNIGDVKSGKIWKILNVKGNCYKLFANIKI